MGFDPHAYMICSPVPSHILMIFNFRLCKYQNWYENVVKRKKNEFMVNKGGRFYAAKTFF